MRVKYGYLKCDPCSIPRIRSVDLGSVEAVEARSCGARGNVKGYETLVSRVGLGYTQVPRLLR